MKLLTLAGIATLFATGAFAQVRVGVHIGIGQPYGYGYYPAPVVVAPPPVYVAPPPVYYPPPAVYCPPPVMYAAPRGFYSGYAPGYGKHRGRGHWKKWNRNHYRY